MGVKIRTCIVASVLVVAAGCALQAPAIKTTLLYQDSRFGAIDFSGQSLLLLPVITPQGFDTAAVFSDSSQAFLMRGLRRDLTIKTRSIFEVHSIQSRDTASLNRFYIRIFSNDIVGLQTSDAVWASMPCRYVLFVRLLNGISVLTLDKKHLRRMDLEAELWESRGARVVWRTTLRINDSDSKSSDVIMARSALVALFKQLPGERKVEHREDW
jgi:hypothetical protein